MAAASEKIKVRSSYNLSALSFTPKILAEAIQKEIPEFKIAYQPDFRQKIADSWPSSINDSEARKDWNWKHEFDLQSLVKEMLAGVSGQLKSSK